MADFYQPGIVTTLHRLTRNGLARIEKELESYAAQTSIGLVLPALYSEFERPAIYRILEELARVRYLRHIVVVVGKASAEQFEHARSFFVDFPTPVSLLWVESEPVQSLFRLLEERGVPAGQDGKGRSCWLAYGYLLATGDCDVIALQDCDVVNYDRRMLARLVYPVAHPNLGFEFSKGYYARVTDRMHGRVTRLFLTPLLRALRSLAPGTGFLEFLDSFRYPLAGEFAMRTNLARASRIPCDWGLEVGVMAEVYRNSSLERVCQVDLADQYEHKHQPLGEDDASAGLRRMTRDIAKSLFRTLAGEGVVLSNDQFRCLLPRYVRMAEDLIEAYYADAMINGLEFDRHSEEFAVSVFARSLGEAAREFAEDPLGLPPNPNWNRVLAAIPEMGNLLLEAAAPVPAHVTAGPMLVNRMAATAVGAHRIS